MGIYWGDGGCQRQFINKRFRPLGVVRAYKCFEGSAEKILEIAEPVSH